MKKEKIEKHKIDIKYKIIAVLTLIFIILSLLYFNPNILTSIKQKISSNSTETTDDITTTEATAEIKTILNTISKTGEIKSNSEEKIELHASYYFSEIYVETNQYIEAGTNILKYTNGTYLTAPYNCVVTAMEVPNTNAICTNKHYVTIKGTNTLLTTVTVDEDELSKVYVGEETQITIPSLDNKVYTGYVTAVSSTATYSSNGSKFTVTVEFQNDGNILIGMTGKTAIILEKSENVVAIPTEAVTTTNGKSYVTIVNSDGSTTQKQVETGTSNDAYIEIKSGVSEGDTVQIESSTSSTSTSFSNFEMPSFTSEMGSQGAMGGFSQSFSGGEFSGTPPTMNN